MGKWHVQANHVIAQTASVQCGLSPLPTQHRDWRCPTHTHTHAQERQQLCKVKLICTHQQGPGSDFWLQAPAAVSCEYSISIVNPAQSNQSADNHYLIYLQHMPLLSPHQHTKQLDNDLFHALWPISWLFHAPQPTPCSISTSIAFSHCWCRHLHFRTIQPNEITKRWAPDLPHAPPAALRRHHTAFLPSPVFSARSSAAPAVTKHSASAGCNIRQSKNILSDPWDEGKEHWWWWWSDA